MYQSKQKPGTYIELAEKAAQLEREEQYRAAAFAWTVAAQHARTERERHWAESRSEFCARYTPIPNKEAA